MIKSKPKFSIGQLILNVLLIAFLLICIFPLLWMISSSIKGSEELFSEQIYLIPKQFTVEHYLEIFSKYAIADWFKNSIGTTLGISVLQILVSFFAAFALGYFKTKLNSFVFYFLLITMVIPFQVTMIPNYILISDMKLLNTWTAVILPNIANATTFFYLITFQRYRLKLNRGKGDRIFSRNFSRHSFLLQGIWIFSRRLDGWR